jgi:anti-anti-sigma factor
MESKTEDKILYLLPGTDLVASSVEALRDFFLEEFKKCSGVDEVVLDATGVDNVDSLGVNLIIGLYRQVESENRKFRIISVSEKFRKVADFFRFPSLFTVENRGSEE